METKKDDAPMQVQKGKTTSQGEQVKKVLPNNKQQPTVEELQKTIEELQFKISSIPENLDERIQYFKIKQNLIHKLSKLDANKENLNIHLDSLAEISAKNEFDNEDYFLTIESGGKYSKKAIFSLQNPVIIGEVISFMMGRIDVKRVELQKQIEA